MHTVLRSSHYATNRKHPKTNRNPPVVFGPAAHQGNKARMMVKFSLNYIEPPHTTTINEYSHVFQFLLKFNLFEYLFLLRIQKGSSLVSFLCWWWTVLCLSSNWNSLHRNYFLQYHLIILGFQFVSFFRLNLEIYLIIFHSVWFFSFLLFCEEILWFGKRELFQFNDRFLLFVILFSCIFIFVISCF